MIPRLAQGATRMAVFMLCLLGVAACSGTGVLNALTPRSGYAIHRDLVFDTATGLALDLYVPAGARAAPVAVFFYGGSWQDGRRADYRFVGEALARQGMVVAIPDYRLYPAVRFPAFLHDAARAVAWTQAHAAEHGGDGRMLVLIGHSAGAYNAAMLTLDPSYLRQAGVDRAAVRGMIGLAGPYDFLPLRDPALQDIFAPAGDLRLSQPITYVDGHNPPMLLIHGRDDRQVSPGNTARLAARVGQAGGPVSVRLYDRMSHVFAVANLAAPLRWRSDLPETIGDYVHQLSGPDPARPAAHAAASDPGGAPR